MKTDSASICQSCGMPMQRSEDSGTEADGAASADYCRYCYQHGAFTDAGITLGEKIAKNVAIAVKMGIDRNSAEQLAQTTLPGLKRWNGNT